MQRISDIKMTNCILQWIVIEPEDNTIFPLNNWGLMEKQTKTLTNMIYLSDGLTET